jgi:2-polyprenyl-3-methyl-5-hydroxy-6-metoxy-1,4-benzoquinol methylase
MNNNAAAATDLALQRTASDYDQTPYRSFPYPLTRPAHLAAVAQLFGLAAPPVATARVLEIGCGGGGNLIPMAAAFPDARFVGVDLSPIQIEQATQRAKAAGLSNIDLRCVNVADVDDSYGAFDYVVCHGVYSRVSAEIRRAILRVAAERLTDAGMAIVSYNVLPGWHLKHVARDAMLTHAAQFTDPAQKLAQARAFLDFLKDRVPEQTPYGQVLRTESAFLAVQRDDFVLHEFLQAESSPSTVLDFLNEAAGAGLAYLADSEVHTMLPETYGAEIAAVLRQISGNRLVQLEQYIDLLTGRTFRQTILMKPAAMMPVQRNLDPARLAGLHASARFTGLPEAGAGPFVFTDGFGRTLSTASAPVARAMTALSARWPQTATAEELTDLAMADDAPREVTAAVILDALFRLMNAGMVSLSAVPIRAGQADATHPVAWPLARSDAARGAADTAGPQHATVGLDMASRTVLPLLDGTRDRDALVEGVMALVSQGTITLRRNDQPIENPDERRQAAREMVDGTLRGLAAAGLLSA